MASSPEQFQLIIDDLATNCLQHANNIIYRCEQFANQDYTSEEAQKLIKLINKISDYLSKKVFEIRESEPTKDTFRVLSHIDYLLKEFASHLRFAVSATTFNLPFSLVKPLGILAKRLIPSTTLLIRPMWKYNYGIYTTDLKKLYRSYIEFILTEKELDDCFASFPEKYFVTSFPFIERKEILLHCILGHELGHLVADVFIILQRHFQIQHFNPSNLALC